MHFKLPEKLLIHGHQRVDKSEVAQSFPPLHGLHSISSKDKDAITLFFTTFILW